MKIVQGREPGYEFTCEFCTAVLIASAEDIRVGYFGVNYGGDRPERLYYTECGVCSRIHKIPAHYLGEALRAHADAMEGQ